MPQQVRVHLQIVPHLLFVGVGARVQPASMRKTLAGRNILTISDREGFARQGGMIELVRRGRALKLAIHRGAAERVGLAISLQLLGVAESVYNDLPDGGP